MGEVSKKELRELSGVIYILIRVMVHSVYLYQNSLNL